MTYLPMKLKSKCYLVDINIKVGKEWESIVMKDLMQWWRKKTFGGSQNIFV